MGKFRLEGSKLENSLGKIRWAKFAGENSQVSLSRFCFGGSGLPPGKTV